MLAQIQRRSRSESALQAQFWPIFGIDIENDFILKNTFFGCVGHFSENTYMYWSKLLKIGKNFWATKKISASAFRA
jgi:hypothetical protein